MANGYGGSSGASIANQNNTQQASGENYEDGFVKELNGVKAPAGFHYMADGKLMSDADHIAKNGYIEKTINNVEINTQDISYLGETRSFKINADNNSIFSIEIYDDESTPNYYNFATNTFSTTKNGLYNIQSSGVYEFSVTFPILGFVDATCDYNNDPTIDHDDDDGAIQAGMSVTGLGIPRGATVSSVTSDTRFELSTSTTGGAVTNGALRFSKLKTYNIDIIAKTSENIQTKHAQLIRVENDDGTINLNKSTGSDNNLLRKILYQDVEKYLFLSCIVPKGASSTADTTEGEVADSNRIVMAGRVDLINNMRVGDKLSGTGIAASGHVLVTKINPDGDNNQEIEVNRAVSVANGVTLDIEQSFKSLTPTTTTGDLLDGRHVASGSSGSSFNTSFSITITALAGRTLSISRTPTTADLCAVKTITFESGVIALTGEDTSSSTYYRWDVANVIGLAEGMALDPSRTGGGTNTTTPAYISKYKTTKSSTELDVRRHYTDIVATTLDDYVVPGIDYGRNSVTAIDRNGKATARKGYVTFDVQQASALQSDSNVLIYGYGANQIEQLTGMRAELSNVDIALTQISTTTTAAVSNSTTIPVTEMGNISTASTVRGINIDSTVANPTVTLKSAASGAGDLTVSTAQTLESGQTLFFDNASNVVTITGDISITNMPISDTRLFFDVERFLTAI